MVLFSALALAISANSLFAQEVGYVSDVFHVPMRSGAGNQFRIVYAALSSGTRVQIHETEGDWSLITTDSGREGWVPSQYITHQPTARIQLAQVEQRLKNTQEQNAALTARVRELDQENARLKEQVQELSQTANQATEELTQLKELSADAVSLHNRHQELLEQHQMLQTNIDTLRAENDRLRNDDTVNKWLYGAGLVLLGIFLSILLPALKPKKRSSDWA